jgi:Domain of Unknown Function with PDB structure (DUF3857)/Transglutaminase-like superfamily
MKPFQLVLPIALSFILLSCSSSPFVNIESLQQELDVKGFPQQSDYPEADAIVLSEVHDVRVIIEDNDDIGTIEKVTKVVKLFKNIESYAFVEIPTYNGDKLTNISARTIKPDGSTIELKDEDFHTSIGEGDNEVFYSDRKITKFTFPAIEKNCIIEYHYTIMEAYPFIQDEWRIQSSIPKLEDIYKLTVPILLMAPEVEGGAAWSWRYRFCNCPLESPTVDEDRRPSAATDKTVTYSWIKRNVPAFTPDPMMPCPDLYLQYVKFAPSDWETWNDISKWYYEKHFKPKLVISDEVSARAKDLTQDCGSEKEKIEKIYAYVQTFRYVAMLIGENGYTPNEPQTVMERKYGDCKDKSALLIALLKSIGVSAKPVLLITAGNGIIRTDFPSWEFNHMIVKATTLDGKTYWMDPTVDHCALGEIPSDDEGMQALVLNDDNTSQIETIPASTSNDNVDDIQMRVTVPSSNEAEFDITMTFKGESNFYTRSFFNEKTHDEMVKFCKSLVADDYLDAEVVDYSFSNLDSVDSNLVFTFKLKVPNAIEKQGDLFFLNIDPFKLSGDWSWLARDKRTYDIHFDEPRTINKTIELELPQDKYAIRDIPDDSRLTMDGLYYEKNYKNSNDGHIIMNETFSIESRDIKARNFRKVKDFIESMRTKTKERIVLTAK